MSEKPKLQMESLDVSGRPFRLEVRGDLPSGNDLMRWYNGGTFRTKGGRIVKSKWRYTKEKRLWEGRVHAAIHDAGLGNWRAPGRVIINYEIHRASRGVYDETNAQTAVDKLIIDHLVRNHKVIRDDNPKHVKWGEYTPVRCEPFREKVIIELEVIS